MRDLTVDPFDLRKLHLSRFRWGLVGTRTNIYLQTIARDFDDIKLSVLRSCGNQNLSIRKIYGQIRVFFHVKCQAISESIG